MSSLMPTFERLSDRLGNGIDKTSGKGCHPFVPLYQIEEVADGVAFYKGFSNGAGKARVRLSCRGASRRHTRQ